MYSKDIDYHSRKISFQKYTLHSSRCVLDRREEMYERGKDKTLRKSHIGLVLLCLLPINDKYAYSLYLSVRPDSNGKRRPALNANLIPV